MEAKRKNTLGEPWERMRQCGKHRNRSVGSSAKSEGKPKSCRAFFSLSPPHFLPPTFFPARRKGIAFLHLRFRRGRDSVLKFLRAGNPYRSGRLVTNLSSIYSRPRTTYPHTTSLFHTRSAFDHPIYTVIDTILSRIIFSVITHPCLVLQKVVRPCFLALSSRQISYGQASSMRIWNSLG